MDRKDIGGGYYYPASTINAGRSPNEAWWVPLAEKAAAKFWVNYDNMHGGNEVEAMNAMTGMPVMKFKTSSYNEDQWWNLVKDFD